MPTYATLMYLKMEYARLDVPARELVWREYRDLLGAEDDRLADPVGYSLWVDFFEDPETVEEAWRAVSVDADERTLRRLLPLSGPVPWDLKEPLLEPRADEPAWRQTVLRALDGAQHDAYGQSGGARAGE